MPAAFASLLRVSRTRWLIATRAVRQHAAFDAAQHPAQPSEERLASVEDALASRFVERVNRRLARRELALQAERVKTIDTELAGAEHAPDTIVGKTKRDMAEAQLHFLPAWRARRATWAQREQEKDAFKKRHLLTREAHCPSLVLAFGILSAVVAGETLANAVLLAPVLPGALYEGSLNALALSLPNIAAGLAGGCGLRAAQHVHAAVRWSGGLLTALAVGAGVSWNCYLGHLRGRAELLAASKQPFLLADWHAITRQMAADPLAPLNSPQAVALTLIGGLVFLVALWDGLYGFSDPYPGFSRVAQRARAAHADAGRYKQRFFAALVSKTRRAHRQIRGRRERACREVRAGLLILHGARAIVARFALKITDERAIHAAALLAYREANRRLRPPESVPDRFHREPLPATPNAPLPYDWNAFAVRFRNVHSAVHAASDKAEAELDGFRLALVTTVENEEAAGERRHAPPLLTVIPALEPA